MKRTALCCFAISLAWTGTGAGAAVQPGVPTYDAFGFAAYAGGKLFALARQGVRHSDPPSGRVAWYVPGGSLPVPHGQPGTWLAAADTERADDRNVAGGMSPSGAVVFFYTQYEPATTGVVAGPHAVVAVRAGLPWTGDVARDESVAVSCCTPDLVFSAYGPVTALPSGRLMQTFYGRDATGASRVFVMFSNDDGRSWSDQIQIDRHGDYAPSETAAVVAGEGATDRTTRLLAVARTLMHVAGSLRYGLMQYVSSDGGVTWEPAGFIPVGWSSDAVTPWLVRLSNDRLALVWADRGSLTIKVSIANAADAFATPVAWPAPREIYSSYLNVAQPFNHSNFGYPSVASLGPLDSQKVVVFYDTPAYGAVPSDVWGQAAGAIDRRNYPIDSDLFSVPLTASIGDDAVRLDAAVVT